MQNTFTEGDVPAGSELKQGDNFRYTWCQKDTSYVRTLDKRSTLLAKFKYTIWYKHFAE